MDLLASAHRRLISTLVAVGVVFLVMNVLWRTVWSDAAGVAESRLSQLAILVSFLLAVALARGRPTQRRLEVVGACFQLFVVAIAVFIEAWRLPLHRPQLPLDTVSWTCVIIVLFPFLVPMTATRTLVLSLLSASVMPLMLWLLSTTVPGYQLPAAEVVGSLVLPPFLCALVALVPAQVFGRMRSAVKEARQLGSYQLLEKLGQGGMGEVWRARHRLLARPAAVKLIRPETLGARDDAARAIVIERFEREAQATAALESPHTVELYDFGVAEDGTLYAVMELLNGLDLEVLVQRFGPLPARRVVHILAQACDSLAEAHERGLVHRDIKPANLVIGRRGRQLDVVKVLDFGLVKRDGGFARDHTDDRLTVEGTVTGTPAYLPPEAVSGSHPIGPRSDLYSLGCVAYWLLTGKLVFDAGSPTKTAFAHATEPPVPPSQRCEESIPDSAETVVMRLLEKDPDDRYQSAADLLAALAEAGVGPWSQEAARAWWRLHAPEIVSAPDVPVGAQRDQ